MLWDQSCNTCDRRDCNGDGTFLKYSSCNEYDRRDVDVDGHCYRIEALMHLIDVMATAMVIVIG